MAILPGKRIRDNSIFGTLTSTVSGVSSSMSSSELADLSVITGDHAIITLDPFRQFGDPEIVMVTAHTASSTSASIQRGMYGTTARQHTAGVQWAHAATVEDFPDIVTSNTLPSDSFEGQLVYQTDTDSYRYFDGVTWRTIGAGSAITLAYAENIVLSQGVTALVPVTGLSVTFTVPAGRRVLVSAHAAVQNTADQNRTNFDIYEGATRLQFGAIVHAAANINDSVETSVVLSPTAGTHTYFVQAASSAGTSTVSGAATSPAYILVEDITGTESPVTGTSVPVGVLAQSLVTSDQAKAGPVATPQDVNGLSVNVVVPAGRLLKITAQGTSSAGTALDAIRYILLEDGVSIDQFEYSVPTGLTGRGTEWIVNGLRSPSAGAHTYKVQYFVVAGAGTLTNHASVNNVNFIVVEDVTPTPTASSGAPSSTLAYAQVVADQSGITAEVDLTGLSVSVTVPEGRRLKITAQGILTDTIDQDEVRFSIKEGATTLNLAQLMISGNTKSGTATCEAIVTPTAGTHTYKLTAQRLSGSGSITLAASSTFPAFILVEDITGSIWPQGSQVTSGIIASEAWTPYTGALPTPTSGAFTTVSGSGRFIKIGRTVHYQYKVTVTTVGTASGDIRFDLPVAPEGSYRAFGTGRENGVAGTGLWVYSGGASFGQIQTGAVIANGKVYDVAGTYESAS